MKILYLTVPSFFDLEISLIRELSKVCCVEVIMILSPESMKSSAFSVESLYPECGLKRATEYDGLQQYSSLIALDKWIIANNPDNHFGSCFRLAQEIKKYIRENNFDVIHSTTGCKTSLFLLPFINKKKNTLYTLHDPIPHNKLSFQRNLLQKYIYACYKNILLLSDSLEQNFIERYKGKYKQIYHSKLGIYDYLHSFSTGGNIYGQYILFFGRIDRYKGVDLLVNAFLKTDAYKKGKIKLVIAGKNVSNINIGEDDNPQIVFLNRYITNEELAGLIKFCQFVVLPYRSATQSGCLFSAFAFNKPVLSTRVGDFPKHVDTSTGLLIKPNCVTSIVQGIDSMMKSDLDQMSESIRQRYSNNGEYGWSKIANDVYKIYQKITKNCID